jgi:hypothetical protein
MLAQARRVLGLAAIRFEQVCHQIVAAIGGAQQARQDSHQPQARSERAGRKSSSRLFARGGGLR